MKQYRKGVSLVAVLLFLLVATIAGTATYKWLNSEGRSSAARLRQSEARQAAIAGVESAKSWMTYHGNETGAIVKQFFSNGKKPVSLDNVLVAMEGTKGSFRVSVVDIDVSTTPYKIKVVSSGESNNGTKHDEVAIFSVSGLYRVASPVRPPVAHSTTYDYSYFGASTTYSGEHHSTSMLINGNWSGNPNVVDKNLIVTGTMELSGNNVSVGGTLCVGGNLGIQNYFETKDLYVDGDVGTGNVEIDGTCEKVVSYYPYVTESYPCKKNFSLGVFNGTVKGDAYFNGNLKTGPSADFVVNGNMTLAGTMIPDLGAKSVNIDGNLCLEPNAKVEINSTSHNFEVGGSLWAPGHDNFKTASDNDVTYDRLVLGRTSQSVLYSSDVYTHSEYVSHRASRKFNHVSSYNKKCESGIGQNGSWGACKDYNAAGCVGADSRYCWKRWDGNDHDTYVAVDAGAGGKHYFYHVDPGVKDVEFKQFSDDYWGHGNGGVYSPKSGWQFPTNIGAYFVGGKQFTNFGGESLSNNFNYANNQATGSPYCKHNGSWGDNQYYIPECHVKPWFKSAGSIQRDLPGTAPIECGKSVKDFCNEVWTEKPGCDGAKYKVDDLLKTAEDSFEDYANTAACSKDIKELGNTTVADLNSCYSSLKSDPDSAALRLYNGYLVVKLSYKNLTNPSGTLNGKYIFIYDDVLGQSNMPPTSNDGMVFLYLKEGTSGSLQQSGSGRYNYFIYTKKTITELMGTEWRGSMYAEAANCAKISNINGSTTLTYDKSVVDDMVASGIICDINDVDCGGVDDPSSSSGSSGESSDPWTGGYDTDYIASGAQLLVQLESEYKNTESYDRAENLTPSIVVLPRIVYLNKDATGKLSDYYTVKGLNGARVTGNGSLTCDAGAPPTTGTMVNGSSDLLRTGNYACTYSESGMSSSFYVSVAGMTSETPRVSFEGMGVDLNSSVANTVEINLIIPGVTSSTPTEFSVDISVMNSPKAGWTITKSATAGLTERTGSSGDKLYTYKGMASTSTQTINLFTVTTTTGAKSGSAQFSLQTPIECMLGSPSVKTINITGSATIKRAGLDAYCQKYPANCEGANSKYGAASEAEDCEYSGIWVEASGSGCYVSGSENSEWVCDAGNDNSHPIKLVPKISSSYCDVFIPEADNTVVGAKDDSENPGGYTLYASLKKKSYTVHVDLSGTSQGSVLVKTSDDLVTPFVQVDECTDYANGCDYTFYAKKYIELTAVQNGDRFSYWNCVGGACKSSDVFSNTVQFVLDNNFNYIAYFNQRDRHCFYTEFTNDYPIFCSSTGVAECIDKCDGSEHCSIGGGVYGSDPKWIIPYANDGHSYKSLTTPDGFIHYTPSKNHNVNNQAGGQSVILNQAQAGANGTMTARIKTNKDYSLLGIKPNEFLNSGLIIRSNADATSYILVRVFAEPILQGGLQASLCYGSGQGITNANVCTARKSFETAAFGLPELIDDNTVLNLTIDVNDNIVKISTSYQLKALSKIKASVAFDLDSDWKYGRLDDESHQYVGFKISDKEFQVSDIGWKAEDFPDEACFDYPNISCSFAANFMGGMVPANENVKPWVGFSSWFEDQNCIDTKQFFYNGCDMPNSKYVGWTLGNTAYCRLISSDGMYENVYGDDGLKLRQSGEYNFGYEGPHGFTKNNGVVRNASVKVECDGRPYVASCGYFMVGTLTECNKNAVLLNSEINLYGLQSDSITLDGVVNMRGSNLTFVAQGLGSENVIKVTLVDDQGVESLEKSIGIGFMDLAVSSMSDNYGFNPEKVKKIRFSSTEDVTLSSITSNCPNAVSISNCSATYSGSQWKISSTISHSESAKKCRITSSDVSVENKFVTCGGGSFTVDDASFYERLNSGGDSEVQYSFTVDVFDDDNATLTSVPTTSCTALSQTYKKAVVSKCEIDASSVVEGNGVPKLTFSIENCPESGCTYKVQLSDGTVRKNDPPKIPKAGLFNQQWQPGVNTPSSKFTADASYYYSVEVTNDAGTETYSRCNTNPSFTVDEIVEATGSCYINGDNLNITIAGANNKDVPVTVTYNTTQGLNIGYNTVLVNETKSESIDLKTKLSEGSSYTIVMRLGTRDISCGTYSPNSGETPDPESSSSSVFEESSSAVSTLEITCPDPQTGVSQNSTVSVTPATLAGCNSDCSYDILLGGSSVKTGSNYNGGEVTFTGANSSGEKEYTFKVTDALNVTRSCTFKVTYETATCTKSDHEINADNGTIDGPFDNGCYEINTKRACKNAQIHASGSGTIVLNGDEYPCAYRDGAIKSQPTVSLTVPSSCSISKIYFSNCSEYIDPDNFVITTTPKTVEPGSYSFKSMGSCSKVLFNCPWNSEEIGCSVKIGSNSVVTGGHNTYNNNVPTTPSVNDVIQVTGYTQIFCN